MFLFILESIGTQELLLIGIVALIFLGPRRMPEMARKLGKILSDFRNTTNEFKETWQREVNFDEEIKSLNLNNIESEPVARVSSISTSESTGLSAAPAIKEIDPASFEHVFPAGAEEIEKAEPSDLNDKKNWL